MRLALILVAVFAVIGCRPDKFTTAPQLRVKSVNSKTISGNQTLRISLILTDKEGDFSNFFALRKTVANCPASDKTDSSSLFGIPQAFINTGNREGEIEITLDKVLRGGNFCPAPGGGVRPDTAIFSFWTRDRAGNNSDTARTDPIIIVN